MYNKDYAIHLFVPSSSLLSSSISCLSFLVALRGSRFLDVQPTTNLYLFEMFIKFDRHRTEFNSTESIRRLNLFLWWVITNEPMSQSFKIRNLCIRNSKSRGSEHSIVTENRLNYLTNYDSLPITNSLEVHTNTYVIWW